MFFRESNGLNKTNLFFLTAAFQQPGIRIHWSISYSKFPYGTTLARIKDCGFQVLELLRVMLCSIYWPYSQSSPALCEWQLQSLLRSSQLPLPCETDGSAGELKKSLVRIGHFSSIWPVRVFMTQATYYPKYLLFSTYMSIQFILMIGITEDYGPILCHLGIGAIWLHNKTHFFKHNLGRCQNFIINMENNT